MVAALKRDAGPAETDDLRRLRRSEISVEEYLRLRVEEAVFPLRGLLSESDLELVRETVRHEIETDPVLIELVARTTGRTPSNAQP